MQSTSEEMDEQTICCILICHKLYLHGSKLDPPANCIINRYLQPHRIPVGAIKHLEDSVIIICHMFEVFMNN